MIPAESDVEPPVMPEHPKGGPWLSSSERQWEAWWQDGASTTWGPADVVSVETLLLLADEIGRGQVRLAPEARLRADGLALTPKGKRDLRLQVTEPAAESPEGRFSIDDYRTAAQRQHAQKQSLDRRRALWRDDGAVRITAEERYGALKTIDESGTE